MTLRWVVILFFLDFFGWEATMYRHPTHVFGTDIPALVAGHDRLHVVFATDKIISTALSKLDGLVDTGKPGLTIQVQNQCLEYPFRLEPPADTPLLVVIYGGLRGFASAIEMVKKVKAHRPDSRIVVTTCFCIPENKIVMAAPLLQSGVLDGMVQMKDSCNHHSFMGHIFSDLVESWPVAF